ncbi:MAG TPA: sulfite exporter TauE/SafE family protein [Casimicrobiaceae bacterium]|nr:sulfite exporter TauE/SafE family protein [Casimicrobiaceae bacterium]
MEHLLVAFSWCVLAGFLRSMGGGGGGILVGVGHISILGIADPNMIKVVNQILEFTSRLISVPLYYRQRRLVWSVALIYGIGAPLGAICGSWLSRSYLANMAAYRVAFGILVTLVAARVLYEAWAKAAMRRLGHRRAHEASERVGKRARTSGFASLDANDAPRTIETAWDRIRIRFGGENFDFNPWGAALGGFAISLVCSLFGVGGGFLATPFLASVLLFPMYLVVGTSLVALMLPLAVSVITYLALRVHVDWALVASEVPGVLVGSFLGPALNQYFNEKALRTFVAVILFATGLYYALT